MVKDIETGFLMKGAIVPLTHIVPKKTITPKIRASQKYRQIVATIRYAGLVESVIVFPMPDRPGYYLLIDGHLRVDVLLALGATETYCLFSKDDESFTYNHKVNRPTPVQEHFMILNIIKSGMPEAEIAQALDVDVENIRMKRDLMNGICPEAVALMAEHPFTLKVIRIIRRMKPIQQIATVTHMTALYNFTEKLANHLYITTPADLLVDSKKPSYVGDFSRESLAKMREGIETSRIQQEDIREKLGTVSINLNRASSHYEKWLANPRIQRHLQKYHSQALGELTHALAPYRMAKRKTT